MAPTQDLSPDEYRALAEFRYQIRRFLNFSEAAARAHGLEPHQHQLLLAIRGLPEGSQATIGELAERLQTQHHSAVELVDRLVRRGAVVRRPSEEDRRAVIVELTRSGEALLRTLSISHREELRTTGPALVKALRAVAKKTKAA